MKTYNKIWLFVAAASLLTGCNFFDNNSPSGSMPDEMYSSVANTELAIAGVYELFGGDRGYRNRLTCGYAGLNTDIEYNGRSIAKVDVLNEKTEEIITFGEPVAETEKTRDISNQAIGDIKAAALVKMLEKAGQDVQAFLDHFKVESASELTEAQHLVILKGLEKKGEK